AASEAAQRIGKSDLEGAIESMKAAQKGISQAAQAGADPPASAQGQRKPGQRSASLRDAGEKQAEIQKAAEALAAAQKKAPAAAMQTAAQALQNANNPLSPITAGAFGPMPAGAQPGLQSAQGATARGSAQAAGGQNGPAQQSAMTAAEALAQAQA